MKDNSGFATVCQAQAGLAWLRLVSSGLVWSGLALLTKGAQERFGGISQRRLVALRDAAPDRTGVSPCIVDLA